MKFSIRDLLLVTVIVALAVGSCLTWLDRQRLAKENVQLREEAKVRQKEIEETFRKILLSLPKRNPPSEFGESQYFLQEGEPGFGRGSFNPPPPANSSAPAPNPLKP